MYFHAPSRSLLPVRFNACSPWLRRRRGGWTWFIVLPQVIKCTQDPSDGQNSDGVGPNPTHCEPIRRAPDFCPDGSGSSVFWAVCARCPVMLCAAAVSFSACKLLWWNWDPYRIFRTQKSPVLAPWDFPGQRNAHIIVRAGSKVFAFLV